MKYKLRSECKSTCAMLLCVTSNALNMMLASTNDLHLTYRFRLLFHQELRIPSANRSMNFWVALLFEVA